MKHHRISFNVFIFTLIVALCFSIITPFEVKAKGTLALSNEGYTLKQVIVLSRHNIRAPLSTRGSVLELATPHTWYNWSANASELSLLGGVLETEMGQYFRKWLESEKLITENYRPEENEVRFYSNSKQRTIATAKYFSAGFLPTANIDIEYHSDYDTMDPVFTPALNFLNEEYEKDISAQVHQLFDDDVRDLRDNFELMADVIDLNDTKDYKDYIFQEDYKLTYDIGQEPKVDSTLKFATSISDALVLQYFEEADPVKAAFGNDLSIEQWESISEIKSVYGDVLFTAPLVATNVANPLIKEIYSEMNTDGRIFTFLCGHDSNIGSVLGTLGVDDYELPETIEKKTPIGCKLVFSRWESNKGKSYWSADMVYQSVGQLRQHRLLDINNEPVIYHLSFKGIKPNKNGLYKDKAIKKLFTDSMKQYDTLYEKYSDVVSYLGPEGTYTQEACWKFFGDSNPLVSFKTVDEAVQALIDKRARYAVIPQENTIGGAVTDYLDTLISQKNVSVMGEIELPINQNILVLPGTGLSDIKTVYSHKQGIAQGAEWLKRNIPNAEIVEVSSTAEGARLVQQNNNKAYAAIASAACADVYGLEVLADGIQGNKNNKTRFYVLSLEAPSVESSKRLAFIAKGKAKDLPKLISKMDKNGMTLVTIHDRPLKTILGEYYYLIECSDTNYKAYEKITQTKGFEFRYLGSFDVE